MTAISKMDLITHISCSSGVDKKTARKVFDSSLEAIKSILQTGQEVRLIDFGSFFVHQFKERKGFNPQKREMMIIPSTLRIRFRASRDLKSRVTKTVSTSKASREKIAEQKKINPPSANQPEKRKTLTLNHQSKTT